MEETRKAACFNGEEDRISRLPDALIHHILSYDDTKYAVQTCVLSKRWIHVWKTLPTLYFNRRSFPEDKKDKFIMFVDMVFLFRRQEFDIQKLRVVWENSAYDCTVKMNVNRWCLNAVMHNAQELCIFIYELHNSPYEIPHHILNCKSVTKLVMRMWGWNSYADIILPRSMNLPQLKLLVLDGLSISDVESSKRLLSCCPVLEFLELIDCDIQTDSQRNLIVDSVSLKEFSYVRSQSETLVNIIKLCAPKLEDFNCESFLAQDYSLEISSPLSEVILNIKLEENEEDENAETYTNLPSQEKLVYASRMMQFLGAVYMAKVMRLSAGFLEVISQAPNLLDCQPPRLCNLESIMLEMWSTRNCLRAIAYLLKISPNITTIYLESKESHLADVGDDWEAGLSFPGVLPHLAFVSILEAEGCDAELKLLGFLLKYANDLVQVVVSFRSSVGSPDRVRKIEEFKKKLRTFLVAPSSIQLVFET